MQLEQISSVDDSTDSMNRLLESDTKIAFVGYPGSGKGEQGKIFAKHGMQGIITSEELKQHAAALAESNPETAKAIREAMRNGGLALDEEVTSMMRGIVTRVSKACFIDGFPRNGNQARQSSDFMAGTHFIHLKIPRVVAKNRIFADVRGRDDDKDPEIVERRLQLFDKDMSSLLDECTHIGEIIEVEFHHVDETAESVNRRILELLKPHLNVDLAEAA